MTVYLSAVLENPSDSHSHTSHLSKSELQNLLAFLLSPKGTKSRMQDLEQVE